MGIGDWGLGIGVWGLGIGPNPQSPIPNPQSPIPNPHIINFKYNLNSNFYNIFQNIILKLKYLSFLMNINKNIKNKNVQFEKSPFINFYIF